MRILVVSGPNLNLLGKREPGVYGTVTLWDIETRLREKYPSVKFEFFQSNSEGALIDEIQKAIDGAFDGVVLNPGAYGHYSYALRDAVAALKTPVVEVHVSNVYAREEFRKHSVIAPVCKGVITGFGVMSYELAVHFLVNFKQ
ncbi:MAG: type II 3-dehydroquinate dehydratase [Ignavibacteriales bacterium]|nr:type II 3-dehydroquinate dehydratase [Ignavibacteriales bacterium]